MISLFDAVLYTLFILSVNSLSEPRKAYRGNIMAAVAMAAAVIFNLRGLEPVWLFLSLAAVALGAVAGIIAAYRINMPDLPQMIALLNGFGGLASGLIGIAETTGSAHARLLLVFIIGTGFATFGGSAAAYLKLAGIRLLPNRKNTQLFNLLFFIAAVTGACFAYNGNTEYILAFAVLTSFWGLFFILPVGGADMPVIISVLNSLSGWCTVLVGFSRGSALLIIVGTLVGASGTILSWIMTKAMNRRLLNVIFPPIKTAEKETEKGIIHRGSSRDAAFLLENATKVIIVPGYGMAASGAQHELANMAKILRNKYAVEVKFAIHPVAGRMPGHMNVLLAEADVSPDDVFELRDINQEFQTTDVAYVIGANDTTNPLAKTRKDSPIYQMPVLEVEQAKKVLFVKRTLAPGYAGIDNPLFYRENTIMLLGDAKEITKNIVAELEQSS